MNSFFNALYWHIYIESLIRDYWITVIFFSIVFACLCAYIANTKHRDAVSWFFLGLFLGIFALISIGFVSELDTNENGEILRCPHCFEPISKTATICQHCGKEITTTKIEISSDFKELNQLLDNKEEWIAKRIIQLIAEGKDATNSQIQAEAEYILEKKRYEKIQNDKALKDEIAQKLEECRKNPTRDNQFKYDDHAIILESFKTTKEILDYLKSLEINDVYFHQVIMPEIEKFWIIERSYGNKVSDVLKYLKNLD